MEVINISKNGTQIDDLSQITVPTDNLVYEILAEIANRAE